MCILINRISLVIVFFSILRDDEPLNASQTKRRVFKCLRSELGGELPPPIESWSSAGNSRAWSFNQNSYLFEFEHTSGEHFSGLYTNWFFIAKMRLINVPNLKKTSLVVSLNRQCLSCTRSLLRLEWCAIQVCRHRTSNTSLPVRSWRIHVSMTSSMSKVVQLPSGSIVVIHLVDSFVRRKEHLRTSGSFF